MTSIADVENETPEQRQVRIAQAMKGHARREAAMRAEEAARIRAPKKGPPPPKAPPTNPFTDPNYALRQLNEYFGSLRKDYGEGAIRGAGFTPRDLSLMQASLRKLQMDPRATPEQHRQAYQQARDALAQRITTPLTAAQPTRKPEITVVPPKTGVIPPRPEVMTIPAPPLPAGAPRTQTPVTPANFDRNAALQQFNKNFADKRQKYGEEFFTSQGFTPRDLAALQGSLRNLQMDNSSTQSQHDAALSSAMDALNSRVAFPVERMMPPVPSASDYIANGVQTPPPMVVPPMAPPMAPPMQPAAPSMNTQPGADFDRNVGRQIFDAEFRTLREKYGDDGLRAAGLTPRTLASLQAPLTNVQRDNTISYDQSSAALENALQQLRGYNFGGAQPAAPMQPAAPAPLPAGAQQSPIPGYYRGGPAMRYR